MIRLLILFFLLANVKMLFAQLDCKSNIVSVKDTMIWNNRDIYFLNGEQVSLSIMVDLLNDESIELYRSPINGSCMEAIIADTLKLVSSFSEDLMLEGYCFCPYCSSNLQSIHKLDLSNKYNYYLKLNSDREKEVIFFNKKYIDIQTKKKESLSNQVLEVGKVIRLDQIYFVGGSVNTLPSSYAQLQELLDLMKKNPTLEIQIEGHVNGLYQDTLFYNQLSIGRSQAIKDFLRRGGVHSNRVKAIGFGNTQMVYPNPKTPEEMEKNRRVEIRIMNI